MKKLGTFFVLAVAFFTFTAQNCSKRDPYTIPGTAGNPAAVGAPQGAIELSTVVGNQPTKYVLVYIGLSSDSVKNSTSYKVSDATGTVMFTNLIINKDYHFRATYSGNGTTYTAKDTTITAGTLNYPGLGTLTLN